MPLDNKDTWLIFQNGRLVIIRESVTTNIPNQTCIHHFQHAFLRTHPIGSHQQTTIHCAELHPEFSLDSDYELITLRTALEELDESWYHYATKAYSILNWDKNHEYCGGCGEETKRNPRSFERSCESCSLYFYPRISPSVITLIQKDDYLLMARGKHFKPGVYGLIAGFVEPGETLEDTIHREIKEEVNIAVKNLRYICSQAWPFPDSLMIGFFADYADGEIIVDNDEIVHADWYRYDQLPGRPSTNVSIASKLIDLFIEEQQNKHS